ncbi:MAG: glycoside hydrolase family 2 TIM barrel-domain containing protein [Lachnospiraceae bacterium]|nr:glycoside hydrolase family 2 TIM barrel-domain containing protein [Lachnospiraceae bacterium]
MRIFDALSAAGAGRGKERTLIELSTIWSEQDGNKKPLAQYPRPQLRRGDWMCLNGYWHYAFTDKGIRPEKFDGRILVPFSPETSRSGVGKRLEPGGYLWYFRSVDLAKLPEGRRLLLHFGAVDERCIVWWNGKLLGSHRNGYLPFSFDVTDLVREGKNTIWVRVQDDTDAGGACCGKQTLSPKGMFYTAQSGIWQSVWMETVPENFIEDVKITPLFDEGEVRLELSLTQAQEIQILVCGRDSTYIHRVGAEEFTYVTHRFSEKVDCFVNGHEAQQAVAQVQIALPEVCPWSPEEPFLYRLVITAGEDCVESYFAMRKFSLGKDEYGHTRLLLNNEPYFFHGVLDQGYWPESLYTPPSDEAMVFDIKKMKELGFNTMRKHIKIEPMRWYYHCDRLGMIVWQDMINGGGKPDLKRLCYLPTAVPAVTQRIRDNDYRFFGRTDQRERRRWEEECMEMVRQLYNCPCIAMWVPFNEGWGQFDALRITERIRSIDTTRLIDHASGWFDQGGGDIRSVHNYFRPLRVTKDRAEERAFVISEYGGLTCPVKGHTCAKEVYGYCAYETPAAFTKAFKEQQKKLRALERQGLCGAVYTQVSDVEEEINGLYTYDRKICKIIE